jgi:cytochrome d ubiquinol oxidase subunit I
MEALAAFFVESTFLGLWIFGWDKLPKKIHLATIWAVAIATNLSAYFILAANSWMQHPVGTTFNTETGRAEMTDIVAVLTNSTLLAAFPHTVTAAFLTAGTFVAGIAAWWMVRLVRKGDAEKARTVYRPAVMLGVFTMLVSGIGLGITGHAQGQLMFEQQPTKMAAAEALCETEDGAAFSILAIGDLTNNCDGVAHLISIPGLTSFLANNDFTSRIEGVNDLQERYEEQYGEGVNYIPDLTVTYWAFRLMIGLAIGSVALALAALWFTRKGRVSDNKWLARIAIWAIPTPFLASMFGWIFTEMGRQPWVVYPNPTGVDGVWLLTERGVSEVVSATTVVISMVAFTLVYGLLAVFWYRLMKRYAVEGVADTERDPSPDNPDNQPDPSDPDAAERPLSFAY